MKKCSYAWKTKSKFIISVLYKNTTAKKEPKLTIISKFISLNTSLLNIDLKPALDEIKLDSRIDEFVDAQLALEKEENVQFIITTHSPNLASKINISQDKTTNVILCKNSKAYSLYPGKTQLQKKDYWHLQHFLDVTKSNMFFAKGVMMVEGWAEAILIPAIARAMEKDLTLSEVSIVNIGSTAYLHFANIYMPTDRVMDMPVAIKEYYPKEYTKRNCS